ncbi:MAG: LysR family transcriptional regulator [Anaerolineales bacterium]|nr:LysR family transcriptional regulator [Anaerolineales bacterium]
MELRHLTYFIAVAQKLNFSRAAEALHVAQPAISQQIKALETQLGVRLFDRLGKRISLTRAGEVLLPHAYQILAAVELAANEVRELGQLTRGSASLGAPPTVSSHMLPNRLMQFHSLYPGLEVSLREAGTESLLAAVADGQLDLAIVASDGLPPVVEAAPFLEEDYVLAVSVLHPLSRQRGARLADLAAEPFILFPVGYRLREVTLTACRRAGFEPKVALDGGAMQSALEFVAAGLGVALVPELALTNAPNIRRVVIEDQRLHRRLSVVWRKAHYLSPAARALRDFLLPQPPPAADGHQP